MRYQVEAKKPIEIVAELEGGHTLVASLWYDEFGPGWWHLEPDATLPGVTSWKVGALGENWSHPAQTAPEYEARGPHTMRNFRPEVGESSYWFWLDLRAASNTGVAVPRFIIELTVKQDHVAIAPDDGVTTVVLPGGKTSFRPVFIEFALP